MQREWSKKIQGIKGLDLSREFRFQERNLTQIIEATGIEAGKQILEVGCGPGTLTRRLAETLGNETRITGLDMDQHFIAYCREQAEKEELANVSYIAGNALELPYEDDTFDICTSHTVIEHVPNEGFIREQYRVCKAGGYVSIMNVRPELSLSGGLEQSEDVQLSAYMKRLGQVTKQVKENMQVGQYFDKPENIMALFETIGLKNIRLDVISYVTCIDDGRNTLDTRMAIIEYERTTAIEYVDMALSIDPTVLTQDEYHELKAMINESFDKCISDTQNGKHHWKFTISPMIIITGQKIIGD